MTDHKEVNMSRAEQERQEVGLTPEEVREINRTKESKSKSRSRSINAAANVLAASLTAAAGTGLAVTAQEALNSAPPPQVRENTLPQPKPPEGVVFSQNIRADAPQPVTKLDAPVPAPPPDAPVVEAPLPDASPEPVYTHRSYSPFTPFEAERPETKDITPLWPDKIGEFAPYNLEIVNRGTKAGVEVMDQELLNNLVAKMNEWAIAPEVPRRVVIYEDYIQLNNESKIPRPNPPLVRTHSGNALLGPQELRIAKFSDGSLQIDVSIPTIKDPSRLDEWSLYAGIAVTSEIFSFLFSDKEGNYQSRDRFNLNYRRDGEYPVYERDENSTIISAPLRARYVNS